MSEAVLSTQAIPRETQQTKEWTPAKGIYAFLMAFNLLSYFWLLATHTGINMPIFIWIPRIATAPLAIYLGKLWKDKGFRILAIYTFLFSLRALIPDPANAFTDDVSESILSALWLFAGCYGMARVLTAGQLKYFLFICSTVLVAVVSVLAGIGIYTAWTDQIVKFPDGAIIQVSQGRLELVYEATVSGAILSVSLLVGTVLTCCIKNRFCKALYIAMLLPIILAIALTDSRTAFISAATGISAMIVIAAIRYIEKKKAVSGNKKIIVYALAIIATLVLMIAFIFAFMRLIPVFNHLKINGFIPSALAEGTEKTVIESRGFDGSRVFSGREDLWRWAYEYVLEAPIMLLRGESKLFPLRNIAHWYGHCHNILLQVLVESGIPGMVLIVLFAWRITKRSIRVISKPDVSLWICLLPAILASMLIADMVESFTWLRASYTPVSAVLFISAGILSIQVPDEKRKKPLNTISKEM